MTASREKTCLYLELAIADGAAERLRAVLAAVPVEAVLLRPAGASARLDATAWRQVIGMAQSSGAAALVAGDAGLARELDADGIHLDWSEQIADDFAAARSTLGSKLIVGTSAGISQHDAMSLGEAGADYVAFPAQPGDSAARLALIEWWSEIFEVPCVALGVTDTGEAAALASAGADFIGVPIPAGLSPAAAAGLIRAAGDAISAAGSPSSTSKRSDRR